MSFQNTPEKQHLLGTVSATPRSRDIQVPLTRPAKCFSHKIPTRICRNLTPEHRYAKHKHELPPQGPREIVDNNS